MKTLLGLPLCLAGALPVHAQDKATMSYEKMSSVFQRAASVKSKEVRAMVVLVPKEATTKPGDVTLTVQSKAGPRRLAVDPDGELHGFPLDDGLLKENPLVLTNQPKGTLSLEAGLALNVPEGAQFSYRQLGLLLDAGNAEIKKQAGLLSFVAPQAKRILFEFYDGHGQSATVGAKSGPRTLHADAKGHLLLPIDPALLAENPAVTFSEKPSKAILDF